MKNFCSLPFDHVNIRTNGNYEICCFHTTPAHAQMNINQHSHQEWLDSPYVRQVQESFKSDQRHPGCAECWEREDQGFVSERIVKAKEYGWLPNRPDLPIKNVEVCFGNLCNLRCLMCYENASSAILAENVRLGINKINQTDINWQDSAYDNVRQLIKQRPYVLNIRGGEPLYNKKLFEIVDEISQDQAKGMILDITTNATQWNQQWKDVLAKFRIVRLMISVDAVGRLYEYIRYPASWSVLESNVQSMIALPNSKCLINCVVQNLNIANLGPLIDWCRENQIWLQFERLMNPKYLCMTNLPPAQKQRALDSLQNQKTKELEPDLERFIDAAIKFLQTTEFEPDRWEQFKHHIGRRDAVRGNSWANFIEDDPC